MNSETSFDELSVKDKIKDFSDLLNKISGIDDKKRTLWIEIYQNAVTDRQNAYAVFMQLIGISKDASTEYAVHGRTMASFIERMSRANDQLIKLAELVAQAEASSDKMNTDDLFKQIAKSRGNS